MHDAKDALRGPHECHFQPKVKPRVAFGAVGFAPDAIPALPPRERLWLRGTGTDVQRSGDDAGEEFRRH